VDLRITDEPKMILTIQGVVAIGNVARSILEKPRWVVIIRGQNIGR